MFERHFEFASTAIFSIFAWTLACALVIMSATFNGAAGLVIWGNDLAAYGWSIAAVLVLIDAAKFMLSSVCLSAWRAKKWGNVAVLTALIALGTLLSIAASFQLGRQFQANSLGNVAAAKSKLKELESNRRELQLQLSAYGAIQHPDVIKRQLNSMTFDRR